MAYFAELFLTFCCKILNVFILYLKLNKIQRSQRLLRDIYIYIYYFNVLMKDFPYNKNNIFLKAIEHLGYYDLPLYKTRFQVVQILIKAVSRL